MRLALVLLPLCYGFIPTQPRRPSQLSVTRQQAEEWVQDVVDEVISQSSTHREDDPYHAAAAAADDDAGARLAAMDADARVAALERDLARQGEELKAARNDARILRRRMAELADENQKLKARPPAPLEEARGLVDKLVAHAAPSVAAPKPESGSNSRLERFRRAREADTPFRVPPGPFAFDI